MRYRALTDIFPVGYPFLPSEAEVRRQCRKWLDMAYDDYNLLIITGEINRIVNPYLKEYTTVVMHNLLLKEASDPDSEYRINSTCLEALEADFRRIIGNAWNEQVQENMNTAYDWEEGKRDEHDTRDAQTLENTSQVNMQLILQEIQRAHERIDNLERANGVFLWPAYTAQATEDDMRTFEDFLRSLCKSGKKSTTKDIKTYLKSKEEAGIITRPEQINTEYEWVKKFQYPYGEKAYYSA